MKKLNYKVIMELDGIIDLPIEKESFSSNKLKNKIRDYVQKSLGCKCVVKECSVKCLEE